MNKLLEFGRRALFYARVLSGYEERRIRNFRLQMEKHLQEAQARKAAISKIPEQIILSEVRNMVEEMKALNKKLEEAEISIEEYFKPLDKQAEYVMRMQLEGEERTSKMMMEAMLAKAGNAESMHQIDNSETNQKEAEIMTKMLLGGDTKGLEEMMKVMEKQLLLEKANAGNTESVHQVENSQTNPVPDTHKVS